MDFADHPRSIKEIRSDRTTHCEDWDPRDVLIDVLRDLDSGKIAPKSIAVVYLMGGEEGDRTAYSASGRSVELLGMLTKAVSMMTKGRT